MAGDSDVERYFESLIILIQGYKSTDGSWGEDSTYFMNLVCPFMSIGYIIATDEKYGLI